MEAYNRLKIYKFNFREIFTSCISLYTIITPIIASLFGMFIVSQYKIPLIVFLPNFIAILAGIGILLLLNQLKELSNGYLLVINLLLILILFSSLFEPGLLGVHRWIYLFGRPINISTITCPLFIFTINYYLNHGKFALPFLFTLLVCLIHTVQPDAGQACVFSGTLLVIIFLNQNLSRSEKCLFLSVILLLLYLALDQHYPLPSIEYVEGIIQLANKYSSINTVIFFMGFLLFPSLFYFFNQIRCNKNNFSLSLAFGVYLILEFYISLIGNYPVPLIGAGASPILGWYMILSLINIEIK